MAGREPPDNWRSKSRTYASRVDLFAWEDHAALEDGGSLAAMGCYPGLLGSTD